MKWSLMAIGIKVLANRNPAELPWTSSASTSCSSGTGLFTTKEKVKRTPQGRCEEGDHLAPGGKDIDAIVVYGVNHDTIKASHTVISNALCTTNCLRRWSSRCTTRLASSTG